MLPPVSPGQRSWQPQASQHESKQALDDREHKIVLGGPEPAPQDGLEHKVLPPQYGSAEPDEFRLPDEPQPPPPYDEHVLGMSPRLSGGMVQLPEPAPGYHGQAESKRAAVVLDAKGVVAGFVEFPPALAGEQGLFNLGLDGARLAQLVRVPEDRRAPIQLTGAGGVSVRACVVAKNGNDVTLKFDLQDDAVRRVFGTDQNHGEIHSTVDIARFPLVFAMDFSAPGMFQAYREAGGRSQFPAV
ncbi:hypothetical protein [Ramlibacter albus]|uniref:Uncharacterized protein n=1 Tax=Ramlibacter albus TaxID=2079448 RepID=A0A923MAS5_9BURK|nr:hypothetical protein [Ramlibacter albus]MBC5766816.1 hypothetical protein [Ramlibacter albus]